MIVGFHHLGIVVPDLIRARNFYEGVLEFEFMRDYEWDPSWIETVEKIIGIKNPVATAAILRGPNCFLELFEYHSPVPQGDPLARRACDYGVAHVSFQVKNILEVYNRLREAGGIVHNPPVSVQDGYSIYCRDPFGNIIELMELGTDEPDFDLIETKLLPISLLERIGARSETAR